jgi:hypothetical protein
VTDSTESRWAGADAVRALLARAGHELRNAQNAAAVNIEVIRSRAEAGTADVASLRSFSENAARGLEESARLAESMVALVGALVIPLASGKSFVAERTGGVAAVEIAMAKDSVERLMTDVRFLAERIGLAVERTASGVILTISADHETNRA